MIVLGVDPGYERMGLAVAERKEGKDILLYSGCVTTKRTLSFQERIHHLGKEFLQTLLLWKPNRVAIETLYMYKNQKTMTRVSEVRGMLIYLSQSNSIIVDEYTPLEIKIAVTGYGRASKEEVERMVCRLLKLPCGRKYDDEIDAIATAITSLVRARATYPHINT